MIKKGLILFSIFLVGSVYLHSQTHVTGQKKSSPAMEGHNRGNTSGPDASEIIQNRKKSGSVLPGRASRSQLRKNRSVMPGGRQQYNPPRSRSTHPEVFSGRAYLPTISNSEEPIKYNVRRYPVGTTNSLFLQNQPNLPLRPSRREKELSIGIWDIGITLGTSHSITDMQNNKNIPFGEFIDYHTSDFNMSFGAFAKYLAADWFSLKGGFNYSKLSAIGNSTNDFKYNDYKFENNIYELSLQTELHVPFLIYNPSSIYIFSGASFFLSNVTVTDPQGNEYQTENDYSKLQPAMPLGIGYSYKFRNKFSVGYEFGWRFTMYHYLDGIKIKERDYDNYFFSFITFGYSIN